jgi:hypothetical protein
MALAVLTIAGGPVHLADMGGWVWAAIILFWIVTSAVSALRRGLKQVRTAVPEEIAVGEQDVEQLPQVRRMSTATREINDDVRADLTQAMSDFGGAGGAEAALRDVAADIQAAKAAATLTVSAARAAAASPVVQVSAGQALTGTLTSILDLRAGAQSLMAPLLAPSAPQPALATAFVGGEPATVFHTPAGLAFAIVAQAVIGPCAGLREEPIQPGGW